MKRHNANAHRRAAVRVRRVRPEVHSQRRPGEPQAPPHRRGPYSCSLCPATFGTRFAIDDAHGGPQAQGSLRCLMCGMKFVSGKKFDSHVRNHSAKRPYVCHLCSTDFIQKYNYASISPKHSGEEAPSVQRVPQGVLEARVARESHERQAQC
ncbi:hypothetical protein HPB51_009832 [Rhipicephalus microplus]|uniref:C2H2-type domain-containing protein n=1 Tax=Rhipicephalus microplus TaxID=6941 RepID=A0A9J6EP01_RHIMP|nr:myoneurin-like [Rhipicephalus microplus]KAH8035836.1 hypothetical protein HPB51_009832 [Rhipicephalus microplus]